MHPQPLVVTSHDVRPLHVLGTQVRFLCEAHSTGKAWSLMELVVPQHAGPPPHHHDWDEAYYITEGAVEFTVGQRHFTATAGDFAYTPAGVVHGFHGASAQPARMLILDVPAHAGAFFKQVDREVKELPRDLSKVIDIGRLTGIHFVQPA
jgi:quercetin dioxygenase-like cupin family protein